jgi:hypothetical protein
METSSKENKEDSGKQMKQPFQVHLEWPSRLKQIKAMTELSKSKTSKEKNALNH